MDYYKKKNLKFNSEVRREIRHAETVKARESSRFKRLSMLRCIDEDSEQPSFEKPKVIECQEVKKPISRLEILRKWKHEKIVKKELEKKNSIRPFYAGASSLNSTNKGTSKIGKCDQSSGNISRISKKVPSCNSSLLSRVPYTSKQASLSISSQTSRIPNSSKQVSSCNSVQTSRIPNSSNKVPSSTTLTSRIQNGSKPLGLVPKTTKNTQSQLQRIPSSNQDLSKKPTVFGNNPKTNQVLLKSKIQTGTSSPASSLNGSSSAKGFQSRIAKPASVVPRRIPVQSKLPVTNNQKQIAVSSKNVPSVPSIGKKLPAVSSSQKTAPGLFKKPGLISKADLKKAPPVLGNQKQVKKAFPESTANRSKEPSDVEEIIPEIKIVEPTCSADCKPESGSERNTESLSEIFDCDVSIIKRPPSFAPENFTFQPPSEILDFSFDFSILKKIKEFTSRTSTPSKQRAKSDEDDEEIIQKPSENVDIETDISTPSKQPALSSVNDKEILHTPSKYLDVETNISSPSKQHVEVYKDDKETMQEPSENVDIEDNISTKQHVEVYKDDKETMQKPSENVDIEDNISSPTEDLVQDSENSPPKINHQDSSQLACHITATTEEEILLKDSESVVAETEKNVDLPLNEEVDGRKYKENIPSNVFQNAYQKRRSILKKSTLNSIAETDDTLSLSPVKDAAENKENVFSTPPRSRRVSKLICIDESPSSTPRRSLRLQKKISKNTQQDDSNDKGSSHTNLTNDFDKLTLEDFDKMNPEDYLCDLDDTPEKIKSKKISLLYSPDKRKSIRRSIRGDLMSFSPVNSPRV